MVFEIEEFQFDDDASKHNVKEIITGKLYTQVEGFRPGRDDVVVDAGAQMGYYSILCARRHGVKSVFAFEPLPENFKVLLQNRERNGANQVVPFNHGLGDNSGTMEWYLSGNVINNLGKGVRKQAETRPLDEIAMPEVTILKITSPGYLLKVLKGAAEKIKESHPKLILRVDSRQESLSVFNFLKHSDYTLVEEYDNANVGELQSNYNKILFYQ